MKRLLLAILLTLGSSMAWAESPSQGAPSQESPGQESSGATLSAEQERRAAAIARQTMSPFCPGRTLADCPSGYATEWRADIREMVAQGLDSSEIQKTLEARAGGNLSGSPNRDAGYGLSIFFGLLALAVLGGIFLRLRSGGAAQPAAGTSAGKAKAQASVDDARLDAELAAEEDGPVD